MKLGNNNYSLISLAWEIIRIWTKRTWNYSLISLVTDGKNLSIITRTKKLRYQFLQERPKSFCKTWKKKNSLISSYIYCKWWPLLSNNIIILRHDVYCPIILSYYSQNRSSVPPKNPLTNLLFESWICCSL